MKISELLDNVEPAAIGQFGGDADAVVGGVDFSKFMSHITDMNAHVSQVDRRRLEVGDENIGTIRIVPPESGMSQNMISQAIVDAANLKKPVCEIVLSEGIYPVDTSPFEMNIVRVAAGRNVIFRGENATLQLISNDEASVVFNLLDNSIISNLIIIGNGKNNGIHIRGNDVTVEGVKVYNCHTGVLVDGEHCTIENSLIKECDIAIDSVEGYCDYMTVRTTGLLNCGTDVIQKGDNANVEVFS